MGQNAPRFQLEKLPPLREKLETMEILRHLKSAKILLGIIKTHF
jgi:hypothetical protein